MARNFIKSLVITTVFVTGISASTARAGEDELVGFLAAAAILFAIGSALDGEWEVSTETDTTPDWYSDQQSWKQVPKQCLQSFTTQAGTERTFEKSCIQQNYHHTYRIPARCEETLWTTVGRRYGYEPQCLRDNGYYIRNRR